MKFTTLHDVVSSLEKKVQFWAPNFLFHVFFCQSFWSVELEFELFVFLPVSDWLMFFFLETWHFGRGPLKGSLHLSLSCLQN